MGATFHEVTCVRQTPGQPHLRWFQASYFDLFAWEDEGGALCRFQLCYSLGLDEHSLTWVRETGVLAHHSVDDGRRPGAYGATPILRAPRRAPPIDLAVRFQQAGATVPPTIREFVLRVLEQNPACAVPGDLDK